MKAMATVLAWCAPQRIAHALEPAIVDSGESSVARRSGQSSCALLRPGRQAAAGQSSPCARQPSLSKNNKVQEGRPTGARWVRRKLPIRPHVRARAHMARDAVESGTEAGRGPLRAGSARRCDGRPPARWASGNHWPFSPQEGRRDDSWDVGLGLAVGTLRERTWSKQQQQEASARTATAAGVSRRRRWMLELGWRRLWEEGPMRRNGGNAVQTKWRGTARAAICGSSSSHLMPSRLPLRRPFVIEQDQHVHRPASESMLLSRRCCARGRSEWLIGLRSTADDRGLPL